MKEGVNLERRAAGPRRVAPNRESITGLAVRDHPAGPTVAVTRGDAVAGTLPYMSPEQVCGDPVLDPGFVDAHAWLGGTYMLRAFFGHGPMAEVLPRAREETARALALDSQSGFAHGVQGFLELYFDWDWEAARASLETALALGPHDMTIRHGYADYLMITGRVEDSLDQVRLGRRYDPLSPLANARRRVGRHRGAGQR